MKTLVEMTSKHHTCCTCNFLYCLINSISMHGGRNNNNYCILIYYSEFKHCMILCSFLICKHAMQAFRIMVQHYSNHMHAA